MPRARCSRRGSAPRWRSPKPTRYAEGAGGIPESVLAELRCHFSEQEVAALTQAAAGEHFFNAATGALGADAQLGPAGTAGGSLPGRRRAAGSGVRNLW